MGLSSILCLLVTASVAFAQGVTEVTLAAPELTSGPSVSLATSISDGTTFLREIPTAAPQALSTQLVQDRSGQLFTHSKCPAGVKCPAKEKWDVEYRDVYTSTKSTVTTVLNSTTVLLPEITQTHTVFKVIDDPVDVEGVCSTIVYVSKDYPLIITYTHMTTTTDFVRSYTTTIETITTKIPYTSSQACTIEASEAVPEPPRSTGGGSAGPSPPEVTIMAGSGTGTLDNSGGAADTSVPADDAGGAAGINLDGGSAQEPLV